MSAFARYIGIDYSGAQTPTASLKGLRVYVAEGDTLPKEVLPPPSPRRYWSRRGIAEWLVDRLAEDAPTLVGIDHGFSFPLRYFETHSLKPDWSAFLDDFQRHWPTDEDHTYVDFVRDGAPGNGAARMGNTRWRRLTEERAGSANLVKGGFGIVGVSYRGFGGSTGSPSETGLLLDAATGYAFCADRYTAERIVVWGESLGTGVAVALASKQPVGRLILEAPFTSAAEVAQLSYPLIPVSLLMKDQFRSDARIGAITVPTLVLHGELDRVVPIALGERLYAAIRAPKRFVRFAKGEHEGLDAHGAIAAVREFLAAAPADLN